MAIPVTLRVAIAASLAPAMSDMKPYLKAHFLQLGYDINEIDIEQGSSGYLVNRMLPGEDLHGIIDIFISAAPYPMDDLEEAELVDPGNRHNMLRNTLVLIKGTQSLPCAINNFGMVTEANTPDVDIYIPEPKTGRNGTPYNVPAGRYARDAFKSYGNWAFAGRWAHREDSGGQPIYNVRRALHLVSTATGPAIGTVYATDCLSDPNVSMIAVAPPEVNNRIIYPIAPLENSPLAAAHGTTLLNNIVNYMRTPGQGMGLHFFTDRGFIAY